MLMVQDRLVPEVNPYGELTRVDLYAAEVKLIAYLRRIGFEVFDLIPVTRFTKDYKIPMLIEAGHRLTS